MKKLVLGSLVLAMFVIVLGAYTRLTDAGLGCPDWPGCYGQLLVPQGEQQIAQANEAYPERPVEVHKAWNEMVHRYFASSLGFVILVIAMMSIKRRQERGPLKLPLFLLALVCFQGALGMWTVTLNLLPVVVMGHLLGGFTVLSCLFLLYLRLARQPYQPERATRGSYVTFALIGIVVLVVQIALGGWTSANYAALACTELPVCEGGWVERFDVAGAFSVPVAENYEYGVHSYEQRMTMHVIHRFGALITVVYLGWLSFCLIRRRLSSQLKNLGWVMLAFLTIQVLLGISNVVFSLPLAVAVSHNAVAAFLLLTLVSISYHLYRKV